MIDSEAAECEVEERNRLRAEAPLPLLSVEDEVRRLEKIAAPQARLRLRASLTDAVTAPFLEVACIFAWLAREVEMKLFLALLTAAAISTGLLTLSASDAKAAGCWWVKEDPSVGVTPAV